METFKTITGKTESCKKRCYSMLASSQIHRFSVFSVFAFFTESVLFSVYFYDLQCLSTHDNALKEFNLICCLIWSFSLCIFCGKKDESFTEDGLDLHYWKHCPMLRRCDECKQVDCYILRCVGMSLVLPSCWFTTLVTKLEDFVYSSALCSQVVEIASLTEHRLGECESRSKFSQCPRCSEAVATEDLTRHAQGPTCNREFTLSHSFLPLANSCKMLKSFSLLVLFD